MEASRTILKNITDGLLPEGAIDQFVDGVAKEQVQGKNFGYGVINHKDTTTAKLAYASAKSFEREIQNLGKETVNEDGMGV